jgi:hypothetical protein
MTRAPQSMSKDDQDAPTLPSTVEEQVTYTPGPGDNSEVKWMGHVFKAHVPHPVRNARLIEMAKTNRFFHVGAFDPAQHGYKEVIAEPKTAEAYRAWAVHWMKQLPEEFKNKTGAVEAACQKWSIEARMRAKLEVGFDDYKYISDFFQPILSELIKREDDPRGTRDMITRNGEFADLFLQVNSVGVAA